VVVENPLVFKNILTAILFRIFVTTIIFLIICFTIGVAVSRGIDPSKGRYYGERKEYYVFCRIYDEKLDRSRKDEERKCFYECSDKETVVVTTSIGYPCQNSITEKRKP
jgi:hypothetical protein